MLDLEESRKKTYTIGSSIQKMKDPLVYTNRLGSDGKVMIEIKDGRDQSIIEQEPLSVYEMVERFYDFNLDPEWKSSNWIQRTERLNSEQELLGKRSSNKRKMKIDENDQDYKKLDNKLGIQKKKFKYCDPETGAYFNTLEEFNKIRALRDIDLEYSLERQEQFLNIFLQQKKKKLASMKIDTHDRF